MREFTVPYKFGRIIVASDCHLDYFDGVAGYSSRERNRFMTEALLSEDADAVIFAGDMTFRNAQPGMPLDSLYEWKSIAIDPLSDAGVPAFALNASHDSMTPEEFMAVFGYEHDFALIHGDVAYICLDTFAGVRDASLQTTPSDITEDVLADSLRIISRPGISAAFVVCHYPSGGENLARLVSDGKVTAVVAGHSHDNTVINVRDAGVDADKKLIQTGHFSRAYTKLIRHGCGFKQFMPMLHGDGMTLSELDGVTPVEDFSGTGSPWQYRAFSRTEAGIESYMIFPEKDYFEFVGDKITFPPFHQPYAEGFGDRSYIKFEFQEKGLQK